jgi:hypothetical protein
MADLKGLRLWSVDQAAQLYKHALSIMVERSRKYAGNENPFANFESSAQFAGTSVEQGILTRLGDKFSRLRNTIDREEGDGVYADESFDDTVVDICNYIILLRNYRRYVRGDVEQAHDGPEVAEGTLLTAAQIEAQMKEKSPPEEKPTYFQKVIKALSGGE